MSFIDTVSGAAAVVASTLAVPVQAAADTPPSPYGYDTWGYGHMFGGWGGMMFGGGLMVLFVIAVVFILVRALDGGDRSSPRPPSIPGLDVLNERYARGEIDAAEYNERKKHILSGE